MRLSLNKKTEKYMQLNKNQKNEENEENDQHVSLLNQEEQAYRRGFRQGFNAGISNNSKEMHQEVVEWSHSEDLVCPPGTLWAGRDI